MLNQMHHTVSEAVKLFAAASLALGKTCMHPTYLRSTSHMHARYRQSGDVHGDTAVQVQGADEKEEASAGY